MCTRPGACLLLNPLLLNILNTVYVLVPGTHCCLQCSPTMVKTKKRPAAALPQAPRLHSEEFPAWARPTQGEPAQHPPWADRLVELLTEAGGLQHPKDMTINLWSDCSGMGSEKIAWENEIYQALQKIGYNAQLSLCCSCERDPAAQKVIMQNHSPRHLTGDIISDRNLKKRHLSLQQV